MEGRTLLRITLFVSSIAFTGLCYRNSNGDNAEAVALATSAACGDGCSASLVQQSRGPFGHEYSFKTERGAAGKRVPAQVFVECKRELVLLGDWHCARTALPGGG